jgi:hypothetical protein
MQNKENKGIMDIFFVEAQLKKYKKRFYWILCVLISFVLLTGLYLYMNYDYLAFKHFIAHNYVYTETLDELFKEELKRDVKGRYYSYFDNFVISVATKRIREVSNDKYTYLYVPEAYKQYKQEEKEEALMSKIQVLNDSTVLLHLTNFSVYTEKFMKKNISTLKSYPNIIIDLRDNYGGDISAMVKISDMFLPKGSIIAIDKMRLFSRVYKAKKPQVFENKNIIILQNNNTASSSENLIAALSENLESVTLIGKTTFGKGIGQFTLPLKNGFAIKATVLLWYGPEGNNIQAKGIEPDIEYSANDILSFALSILD